MATFSEAFASDKRTIAVDCDDVLCQTNATVAEMHNEIWGTDMTLEDFQHYLYWQNRGWGSPEETLRKVRHLYASGLLMRSPPIEGALQGLTALKELGYRLVVVTARSDNQREETEAWLAKYLPDVFEGVYYTGAFAAMHQTEQSGQTVASMAPPKKKASKADIGHQIGAFMLIDDSIENALDCATHHPNPLPVLLFGPYPWNRHVTKQDSPYDKAAHDERIARGIDTDEGEALAGKLMWSGEDVGQALPACVHRVRDWTEVVSFVKAQGKV